MNEVFSKTDTSYVLVAAEYRTSETSLLSGVRVTHLSSTPVFFFGAGYLLKLLGSGEALTGIKSGQLRNH